MDSKTKRELKKVLKLLTADQKQRFERLWDDLCKEKFLYQEGNYPVSHGEAHIRKVLQNLGELLQPYKVEWDENEILNLLAAAMIHDIGLIQMRPTGTDDAVALEARGLHASEERMKQARRMLLAAGFDRGGARMAMRVAVAHAGDTEGGPAEKKIQELKAESERTGQHNLWRCGVLLQVADFLDVGEERLTHEVADQDWTEAQLEHYKKHASLAARIDTPKSELNIYLTDVDEVEVQERVIKLPLVDRARILDATCHEAREAAERLNEAFGFTGFRWHVRGDESLFGNRLPLGQGAQSFTKVFSRALREWEALDNGQPMPVDMMGHSLYGRFIKNEEGLNDLLLSALKGRGIHLRVLILDPNVENQQMREVYSGQVMYPAELGRSILPLYDGRGDVPDLDTAADGQRGDILETLRALEEFWLPSVGEKSILEVRATTRVMYSSMSRFGSSLIVTPYKSRGLFKESQSWLYRKESPFRDSYMEVFENIWISRPETTVRMVASGANAPTFYPLEGMLAPFVADPKRDVDPLDYEQYMLRKQMERIKAVFDYSKDPSGKPIPPFEVEIQPSEDCTLHCSHCVGRHLSKRKAASAVLESDLQSLLEYEADGWRVERFRISGLLGDPLSDRARTRTLDFLARARDAERAVVVLTNGVALSEPGVVEALVRASHVHVSLDSASPETFSLLKGTDDFDSIVEGVRRLCAAAHAVEDGAKVGLGFVVTQENVHEVVAAMDRADSVGADFVRFKPDVRGMHSIGWRNWKEAKRTITDLQDDYKARIVITDKGWTHYRVPALDRCWAQFFYSTVGADGKLYACDHLTANGDGGCLGALGDFGDLWREPAGTRRIGVKHRECSLCPPWNWRMNHFLSALNALYEHHGWDRVEAWVSQVLSTGEGQAAMTNVATRMPAASGTGHMATVASAGSSSPGSGVIS